MILKGMIFVGYMALYRKMRPKNFEQVVGQEHIIRTLCNQIKSDRISHAYLFCGTRGTGKTSTAKIFAKAVNCLNPNDGQPCGECDVCKRIEEGSDMNVIEIDAASNNSVDNVREIRDEVKYPPTDGRFKVYIIDEVHMLSIGAFNALLKTLEEPPAHVIFILATTDPQKIPVTIHSRCQRFDFKRISAKQIGETLKKYMEQEGVSVTDEAIDYIANVADGAMRDALSIMDQCTAFYFGEEINLEKVLEVCGAVDSSVFFDMTEALFLQQGERCMKIIENVVLSGRDIVQFINDIIIHFRNIIVSLSVSDGSYALGFSDENAKKYREQGEKVEKGFLMELINEFSILQGNVKYSSNPRVLFEVECLKICNPVGGENIEQIKLEIRNIQKKLTEGIAIKTEHLKNEDYSSSVEKQDTVVKPKPKAVPDDMKAVIGQWRNFVDELKVALRTFLLQTKPKFLDDKFYIVCSTEGHFNIINKAKKEIEEKLGEKFGKKFNIFIVRQEDFDAKCNEFDMTGVEMDFDESEIEENINSQLDGVIYD